MTEEEKCYEGKISFERFYDQQIKAVEKLFEQQMRALEKLFDYQIKSLDEKARLLRDSMEKRLEGLNENRASLDDMVHTLVPKQQWESELKGVRDALQQFRSFKDGLQAVASQKSVNISYLLSLIAIFIALGALIIKLYK